MAAIEIPCPQCGRTLKVPDRSMLGRKGRCSKCRHGFILQDPAEAQTVTLKEPPASAPPTPVVVFSSIEESAPTPISPLPRPSAPVTNFPSLDDGVPELAELEALVNAPSTPLPHAAPKPVPSFHLPTAQSSPEMEIPGFDPVAVSTFTPDDTDSSARRRKQMQQAKRRRLVYSAMGLVALIGISVGLYAVFSQPTKKNGKKGVVATLTRPAKQVEESAEEDDDAVETPDESDPTKHQITLNLVPDGARIVIHLRPAELWQSAETTEEFRLCLGPLGVWLEEEIKKRCLHDPSQIEEALFALIPISRDEFDVAVVVRATKDFKRSDLITKFDGELVDLPKPHYVGAERSWIVSGNRTFASAPASMAQSLAASLEAPATTSDGVSALLSLSDRRKQFSLICDLEDVRLGSKSLAPEKARKLLDGIVDFFGDDVDALSWSWQLGDKTGGNKFKSELLVRNRLSRSPKKLQGDLKKKLAQLPAEVLELVQMTNPQKIGHKKVVGRYPIMTKMVEQSTTFETGHRLVRMKLELPERAAPNLALGTLLTWNQTTLPGFGTSSAPAATMTSKSKLPDKIADRLKTKLTAEFKREFFYKTFEFIGDEIGVTFKLDGPGWKDMGVTQNEYQTFTMENVPATAVLHKLLVENTKDTNFPNGKLVLIVDEEAKTATITGVNFAKNKNQTPFPLEPAK